MFFLMFLLQILFGLSKFVGYVIQPPPQAFPEHAITDYTMRMANLECGSSTRDTLARRSDSPWLILAADANGHIQVQ
jgi:hypothetical protein